MFHYLETTPPVGPPYSSHTFHYFFKTNMPSAVKMTTEADTALAVLVPPTTFHPFPKLPFEIRIKIWAFAANEQSQFKKMVSGPHVATIPS